MTRRVIGIVAAVMILAGLMTDTASASRIPHRECATKQSRNCVWDGLHSHTNGHARPVSKRNRSFYRTRAGRKVYISHRQAHRILFGHRAAALATAPIPVLPIVEPRTRFAAVGDEITLGFGTSNPSTMAWPVQAGINYRATAGRCLGYETCPTHARYMLDDFSMDATSLNRPVVIALIGTHDLSKPGVTARELISQYAVLDLYADDRAMRIVYVTLPPFATARPENALRLQVNAWMRTQPDYIDLEPALVGPDGLMRPEFTSNGVTPNDAGSKAIANRVTAWMFNDMTKHGY